MWYFLQVLSLEARYRPFMMSATPLSTESQGCDYIIPTGHGLWCMMTLRRKCQPTHKRQSSVFYFCLNRVLKCVHEYLH